MSRREPPGPGASRLGEYTCAAFRRPLPDRVSREVQGTQQAEQTELAGVGKTGGEGTTSRSLERVRRLCLALPETSEMMAWGHPVFKAGTKTFVALEPVKGRPSIAFRLEPLDVDLLTSRGTFFETPYGRGLWASTWADARLDWTLVASLIERSYRLMALKRMLLALDGTSTEATPRARTVRRRPQPR